METGTLSGKHLYNRGWFGLIPLIGGFVGLAMIFLGVFKYKDRKLILIGSAALLFTVAVYGSMFYYFDHSKSFRKDFSVFSQPYINELIKSIEFYKTENGHYPHSLDELTKSSKLVRLEDPIAQSKTDNKRQFYYKRLGNRYTLFSSGIDRIPYNSDDIFPSANLFDSTRTGLMRPQR
jgi:hypothetical protein